MLRYCGGRLKVPLYKGILRRLTSPITCTKENDMLHKLPSFKEDNACSLTMDDEMLISRSPNDDGWWVSPVSPRYFPFVNLWMKMKGLEVEFKMFHRQQGLHHIEVIPALVCNGVALLDGVDNDSVDSIVILLPDDKMTPVMQENFESVPARQMLNWFEGRGLLK